MAVMEALHRHLRRWAYAAGYVETELNAVVDLVFNTHARQLAEKQRQWLRDEGYELDCVCEGCTACLAREYIDRIDPEKET